jgi:citrate lyase beta subunit
MASNDLNKLTLSRSLLSVPVNNPRFVEKPFKSAADIIMLDLEDSVVPSEKADARIQLLRALERSDRAEYPVVAVRVNAPSSTAHQDDVMCLVAATHKPDLAVVPKVERATYHDRAKFKPEISGGIEISAQSLILTFSLLFTVRTPSVARAIEIARSAASWLGTLPSRVTTP